MEAHHRPGVPALQLLLVVGVAEEGQGYPVRPKGGLDDIGDVLLIGLRIEILHAFPRVVLMLGEIVVGAVGNAPQLPPVKGEPVLEVGGGLGVEGQLLLGVIPQTQVFLLHPQVHKPLAAVVLPVGEPFQIGAGLHEELQFHLLEFPGPEDEVAGGDFVTEAFPYLGHPKGDLLAAGALDVHKVDKDALGSLRPEVEGAFAVLGGALEGLEHEVELADGGKVLLAAVGAFDVMLRHKGFHPVKFPALGGGAGLVLDKLVGPVPGLALLAVHQGIRKSPHMAGGHPDLGVHQDGAVQAHIVGALLDKALPPGPFYVVLKLHPQRAVVPGVGQAAVDLAPGVDKAPPLAEGDDGIHGFFRIFHRDSILPVGLFGPGKRPVRFPRAL